MRSRASLEYLSANGVYEEMGCGRWTLSGNPNENFRARFELILASHAGIRLGRPADVVPLDYWLHRLFSQSAQQRQEAYVDRE